MALVGLVLLLTASRPVGAEAADEAFRQGRVAWDAQRWAEVVVAMRAAIAQDANEGATIRLYGQRFENYLPHLYLGLALAKQGECAEALPALAESSRQGRLNAKEQRWLDAARADCETRVGVGAAMPKAPAAGVAPTVSAPADSTPPSPQPPGAWSREVQPAPALRRAAGAFLAQSYAEVVDLLADFEAADPPNRATGHLLRAAALYARYLEGGRRDEELRRQAETAAAAYRAAPAGISPAESLFSPPIRQWLRGGGSLP